MPKDKKNKNNIIDSSAPEFASGMHMPNNQTQYRPNMPDVADLGFEDELENEYLGPLDAHSPYDFRMGGIDEDEQHNRLFGGESEVDLPPINKSSKLSSLYDSLLALGLFDSANDVKGLISQADDSNSMPSSTSITTLGPGRRPVVVDWKSPTPPAEAQLEGGSVCPGIASEQNPHWYLTWPTAPGEPIEPWTCHMQVPEVPVQTILDHEDEDGNYTDNPEEEYLRIEQGTNPQSQGGSPSSGSGENIWEAAQAEDQRRVSGESPSETPMAPSSVIIVDENTNPIGPPGCSGSIQTSGLGYWPIIFATKQTATNNAITGENIPETYLLKHVCCYGRERWNALRVDFSLHMAAGHGMTGAYWNPGSDQFWLHWNTADQQFEIQRITYWYARKSDWGRFLRDLATPGSLELDDEDPRIPVARTMEMQETSGTVREFRRGLPIRPPRIDHRQSHTADINLSEGTDMGDFLNIIWDVYKEVDEGTLTEEQGLLNQLYRIYTRGFQSRYTLNRVENYVHSPSVNAYFSEFRKLQLALREASSDPNMVILSPSGNVVDVNATSLLGAHSSSFTTFLDVDNFYRRLTGEIG